MYIKLLHEWVCQGQGTVMFFILCYKQIATFFMCHVRHLASHTCYDHQEVFFDDSQQSLIMYQPRFLLPIPYNVEINPWIDRDLWYTSERSKWFNIQNVLNCYVNYGHKSSPLRILSL